jgi:hypothetical protein
MMAWRTVASGQAEWTVVGGHGLTVESRQAGVEDCVSNRQRSR